MFILEYYFKYMYIRTKFTKITIKIKIKIFCTFISLNRHSVDYLNLNKNCLV